jgi:uncharacterized protein YcnI
MWLAAWPLLLLPAVTLAHAVVYPERSTPGTYEKYVLRVPNEAGVPTTRVEIRFPPEVRVISFADVPGWTLAVESDTGGRVTAAVWTGSLPSRRFVEFPFMAVNPRNEARLEWPVYQTYADSVRIDWTGPEDSDRPASSTLIVATEGAARSGWAITFAAAALAFSLVAVGLARRALPLKASR